MGRPPSSEFRLQLHSIKEQDHDDATPASRGYLQKIDSVSSVSNSVSTDKNSKEVPFSKNKLFKANSSKDILDPCKPALILSVSPIKLLKRTKSPAYSSVSSQNQNSNTSQSNTFYRGRRVSMAPSLAAGSSFLPIEEMKDEETPHQMNYARKVRLLLTFRTKSLTRIRSMQIQLGLSCHLGRKSFHLLPEEH